MDWRLLLALAWPVALLWLAASGGLDHRPRDDGEGW